MKGLCVSELSAGYGKLRVISGINLSVDRGEIVALIGRNGAGKSTTLLGIAGALPQSSGDICVNGIDLRGPSYKRSRTLLGMVPEARNGIIPSLTGLQNLRIGDVNSDAALSIFPELEKTLDIKAGLMSGGEQQMLALARAICRKPRVLLIDELSFGLAPIVCWRLFSALRNYADVEEAAVLLVEQHLPYAENVADRVLVMRQGEISLELPASELKKRAVEIEKLYLGGPVTGADNDRT